MYSTTVTGSRVRMQTPLGRPLFCLPHPVNWNSIGVLTGHFSLPFISSLKKLSDLPHRICDIYGVLAGSLSLGANLFAQEESVKQVLLFVVQSLSHVRLFVTQWTTACQASLSFTIFQSLLKLMSTESVMPSNHLILCCPFSYYLQFFPASGSFPRSHFFASGGQSIGISASFTYS